MAAITGQELDHPASYTHRETNKTPEFLAKFPHGKVPAFEGKDGFTLVEGVAIARYRESLSPSPLLRDEQSFIPVLTRNVDEQTW